MPLIKLLLLNISRKKSHSFIFFSEHPQLSNYKTKDVTGNFPQYHQDLLLISLNISILTNIIFDAICHFIRNHWRICGFSFGKFFILTKNILSKLWNFVFVNIDTFADLSSINFHSNRHYFWRNCEICVRTRFEAIFKV